MNVNVLLVVSHHTVAELKVTYELLNVISLAEREDVETHTESVHVKTIDQVDHDFKGVTVGSDHVQTGAVLSTHASFTSVYPSSQLHFA